MGSLLVHVTHGPEAATRAALAVLVARAAVDAGHDVAVFFAGDAVNLLRDATADAMHGIGTGDFGENLRALGKDSVAVYASAMSSKARGIDGHLTDGPAIEFAMPSTLVELTMTCDRASPIDPTQGTLGGHATVSEQPANIPSAFVGTTAMTRALELGGYPCIPGSRC